MAQVTIDQLLINNDNDVKLAGFKDSRESGTDVADYLNAGSVSYEVKTASGTVVATGSMAYVASSKGDYLGIIEKTVSANFIEHGIYYIEISATQGDVEGFWREQSVAAYRQT